MRLGIRLLFAFFLINGIAAFFVLRVFMAEIKPSVREVMEDMMVDTANILAELASEDLAAVRLALGPLLRKPQKRWRIDIARLLTSFPGAAATPPRNPLPPNMSCDVFLLFRCVSTAFRSVRLDSA